MNLHLSLGVCCPLDNNDCPSPYLQPVGFVVSKWNRHSMRNYNLNSRLYPIYIHKYVLPSGIYSFVIYPLTIIVMDYKETSVMFFQ